ncbi:nuclear transport factor 2 family protein [Seongchinamella unica]|uniref:Nuclear transport factor 2 family protein n=1 Tax=Seongchinamella unica TaxID=2547392 RepID=A0A4R5LVP3_9GAMM|nr:nuclear transport factor 2 family protein [Seongchinamella unica]TDG15524.1 nuclear transport factor 2 family protein [Seongchinamella unica]
MNKSLQAWHRVVANQDTALLRELLAEDCVFLSPVVHTPQRGRDITLMYLTGAMHVLQDGFHYQKEIVDDRHAVLEFVCEIDGVQVNGVDIISFDEAGKICEFKVMLRPLKAINRVHEKMRQMLEQLSA